MSKRLLTLALSAAFSMAAANAHADAILIGGTSLTLVYNDVDGTICDSSGCDAVYATNDLGDAALLTSLDFEVGPTLGTTAPVGSVGSPTTDIYVDVALFDVDLDTVLGSEDNSFFGIIDFYTIGPDGNNFLQLDVTGVEADYNGAGLSLTVTATGVNVFGQSLDYSFGSFVFTVPGIGWAFSSSASEATANGFAATGTPDWSDTSVGFDTPVPEPASMLLLGTGLLGSAGLSRLRRRRSKK